MSDPSSITGSAVGVISLGIATCQVIYSFIDDARSAEDKAEDIRNGLDRLESHLERLELELSKLKTLGAASSASENVVACADALHRIRQKLTNSATSSSSTTSSKFRQQFQSLKFRFMFPFRKADLQHLRSLLESVQADLQLALSIVIM